MPKIIDNVRERLICEARRQLDEHGYSAMTIRSVAAACSVGVGTVYNYFPSKDMLIAAFMLEDWQKCLDDISETLKKTHHPETVLHTIYDQLQQYIASHTSLFTDKSAVRSFASSVNQYHSQLRSQIAENIRPICLENARQPSDFLCEFVAESILTWTVSGRSFSEIYAVLKQLINADER